MLRPAEKRLTRTEAEARLAKLISAAAVHFRSDLVNSIISDSPRGPRWVIYRSGSVVRGRMNYKFGVAEAMCEVPA